MCCFIKSNCNTLEDNFYDTFVSKPTIQLMHLNQKLPLQATTVHKEKRKIYCIDANIKCANVSNKTIYVTGFARRGLIRAPLQSTDFTTVLWIHHQTIHVCMFCGQQFTSLLFLRLLSEPCQTSMNARFVLSRFCWLFNKGYQAVRSHTTLL